MKNIFISILTILLYLNIANAQTINECKTDIYFGNGVWNDEDEAEDSRIELQYIIDNEIINGNPKLQAKYGKIKLQYNWGEGTMYDVLETYYQLKAAGQVNNYQFFAAMYALSGGNFFLSIGVIAGQRLMEPFVRSLEEGNVDEMWEKYYNESFKLGHRVLLVSHSQGNLFANRIYDIIAPIQYQNYFANLQVASPASSIKAQKGDYVTLSTDSGSYDPVVNFIPGSMSPNVSGGSGHAFISAYLSQADPFNDIVTKTKQLLLALDLEDTQWQTDQEFDKGTKDYMITVKHRFDTSVIMNEQVHPFAPSKKLYYVSKGGTLGYVKSSCENNIQYLLPLYEPDRSWEEKVFTISDKAIKVLISLDNYTPCGYTFNNSGYVPYTIYVKVNSKNVITFDFSNLKEEDYINVDITDIITYGENYIEASCYSHGPYGDSDNNYVSVKIESFF